MRQHLGAIVPHGQTLNDQAANANLLARDWQETGLREVLMNMAKWLLLAIVALPVAELVVFIAVAASIGFGSALLLVLATSFAGGLLLRHAGGNHIARVRTAINQGSFTAIQTDSAGAGILFAGFLLLIPGFITDVLAVLVLVGPLRRALAGLFGGGPPPRRADGVLDLDPEQWQRVPDKELPDRHERDRNS